MFVDVFSWIEFVYKANDRLCLITDGKGRDSDGKIVIWVETSDPDLSARLELRGEHADFVFN